MCSFRMYNCNKILCHLIVFFGKIKIGDSMDIRKIAFGILTLSFIMIISGSVSSFVIGLKRDREQTYKRVSVVNDEFEVFSTNTSVFEIYRDELYTATLSNLFYDTMYQEDSIVKDKLSNYEQLVDELVKNARALDKLCTDVYYPNSEVNSKCNNYRSIYEQIINYFVTDIHLYNENVKKFNDYQRQLGSFVRIREYSTKKDYVDYNGDGSFDGKEE